MKLMHEKNHEFARIMNCEIMKCEDPRVSWTLTLEDPQPVLRAILHTHKNCRSSKRL